MLVTFDRHPRTVFAPEAVPPLLTTSEEKTALLKATGIDEICFLPFDRELAAMSAHDFMAEILQRKLHTGVLVIGYDHRFGHNREEGFEQYVQYGKEMGLEVVQAQVCSIEHVNVSSSVVRSFLGEGYVDMANRCLGYEYAIEGRVVHGFQVGRKLGFPTANIQPEDADKMLPANGVYAVKVDVQGRKCFGMLNIGCRPTLDNGSDTSIEAHLFDFEGNLYGQTLTLFFLARLRAEYRFTSEEALAQQLLLDKQAALQVLSSCR